MARPVRAERGAKAFNAGRMAEHAAAFFLRLKGYRVVAERYKTPVGEIDLIARKGGCLVFVEVKWRPARDSAAEAVGRRQRVRIGRAAAWYLAHRETMEANCRFDAVLVVPWRLPLHIKNAWQIDE